MLKRVLLAAGAAILALLAFEGAFSLFLGRSLRPSAFDHLPLPPGVDATAVNGSATATRRLGTLGVAQFHSDPRVNYRVLPGKRLGLDDYTFEVEPGGWRLRSRPIAQGAMRIVILGDSVAFGSRLSDDETIAEQLETILDNLVAPDGRDVACFTCAAPGWNHSNAVRFLLDDLDRIAPDVVVYIPVDNDLADSYVRREDDTFGVGADPMAEDPLLACAFESAHGRVLELGMQVRAGKLHSTLSPSAVGPVAIVSDLTRESRRRYDENVASIALLGERLAGRSASLYVMPYVERGAYPIYTAVLRERIARSGLPIQMLWSFAAIARRFTFEADAHPNKDGAGAMATWIARQLVQDRRVVPSAGREIPPLDPELDRLRATPLSDDQIAAAAEAFRAGAADVLQSRIDVATGRGCLQVYGGLQPDGAMGPRMLAMLKRSGGTVGVRLGPVVRCPRALWIHVDVFIDGRAAGSIAVDLRGEAPPAEGVFAIPDAGRAEGAIEVSLVASDWTVRDLLGVSVPTACGVLDLESLP